MGKDMLASSGGAKISTTKVNRAKKIRGLFAGLNNWQ